MVKYKMNKKETAKNNQWVWEYINYMMLTGYFGKAECKTPILEKRLYVHYKETREDRQVQLERISDAILKRKIIPLLPKEFVEGRVEIRLVSDCFSNMKTVIHVTDGISELVIRPDAANYRKLRWKFFEDKREARMCA